MWGHPCAMTKGLDLCRHSIPAAPFLSQASKGNCVLVAVANPNLKDAVLGHMLFHPGRCLQVQRLDSSVFLPCVPSFLKGSLKTRTLIFWNHVPWQLLLQGLHLFASGCHRSGAVWSLKSNSPKCWMSSSFDLLLVGRKVVIFRVEIVTSFSAWFQKSSLLFLQILDHRAQVVDQHQEGVQVVVRVGLVQKVDGVQDVDDVHRETNPALVLQGLEP